MTNPPERVTKIATRILTVLDEEDRSLNWLSRKSGVPYSTLRTQLKVDPKRLSAHVMCAACEALNIELPDLVA